MDAARGAYGQVVRLWEGIRKVSGFTRPSGANEGAFEAAVDRIAAVTRELVDSLVTTAVPKDREVEAMKARARAAKRYG